MTAEEWRSVQWAPDYEVSNMGRVRSLDRVVYYGDIARNRKGKVLKQMETPTGYRSVSLRVDQSPRPTRVHVLVLEAFNCPRPKGRIALHINGDPADNRIANLRWGTHRENNADTLRHGRHASAAKTHCVHGHEYTPDNTYIIPSTGARTCKACQVKNRRRYQRRKALGISGPSNKDRTACVKGHPLSGDNLYLPPSGGRACRECHRQSMRAHYANLTKDRKAA